jgi:transposase
MIIATDFDSGRTHDFALFKAHRPAITPTCSCLADSGYQGINAYHGNSQTPRKKSKRRPLSPEEKAANRQLSRERVVAEHIIGRLKVFRILAERYRNRRKRFALRFNLIAALYNYELAL